MQQNINSFRQTTYTNYQKRWQCNFVNLLGTTPRNCMHTILSLP